MRNVNRLILFEDRFDENENLNANIQNKSSTEGHLKPKKYIYINVDDEKNIFKMNTRICAKMDIELKCCKDRAEFLHLLEIIEEK